MAKAIKTVTVDQHASAVAAIVAAATVAREAASVAQEGAKAARVSMAEQMLDYGTRFAMDKATATAVLEKAFPDAKGPRKSEYTVFLTGAPFAADAKLFASQAAEQGTHYPNALLWYLRRRMANEQATWDAYHAKSVKPAETVAANCIKSLLKAQGRDVSKAMALASYSQSCAALVALLAQAPAVSADAAPAEAPAAPAETVPSNVVPMKSATGVDIAALAGLLGADPTQLAALILKK